MTDSTQTTPPGEQTGKITNYISDDRTIVTCPNCLALIHLDPGFIVTPAASVIGPDQRAALGRSVEMHAEARNNYVWRSVDREVAGKSERTGGDGPSQAELDRWERLAKDRWAQEHPHFDADLVFLRDLAAGGEGDE